MPTTTATEIQDTTSKPQIANGSLQDSKGGARLTRLLSSQGALGALWADWALPRSIRVNAVSETRDPGVRCEHRNRPSHRRLGHRSLRGSGLARPGAQDRRCFRGRDTRHGAQRRPGQAVQALAHQASPALRIQLPAAQAFLVDAGRQGALQGRRLAEHGAVRGTLSRPVEKWAGSAGRKWATWTARGGRRGGEPVVRAGAALAARVFSRRVRRVGRGRGL
jgi:hypothetical protein